MPSKYAAIFPRLRKLVQDDSPWQQKVQDVKTGILQQADAEWLPASKLAMLYVVARNQADAIKEELELANLELEALKQMLVNQYEVEDTSSITLADGCVVRTQPEIYPQVKDKEAFRQWCIANGLAESMHLHPATTASIVKERLQQGLGEPEGVEAFVATKVVLKR